MGCLYQLFKIVMILIILVNIGTGYTKFYKLIVDITKTVRDVGSAESFTDVAWIPFLVVQVASTLYQFIQLYCLFRELCEDNFMYKHCFKCCFILVLLIYCLSVLPKSILTIIYYKYSSSSEEPWELVASFFDSLLSGVTALGFQIVLFMPVIRRTLRSAGICRRKIWPTGTKNDTTNNETDLVNESDLVSKNDCCIFVCCKSTTKSSANSYVEEIHGNKKSKSVVKKVGTKVKRAADKGMELKSSLENRRETLERKTRNMKEKKVKKFEQEVEDRKLRVKSKVTRITNKNKPENDIHDSKEEEDDPREDNDLSQTDPEKKEPNAVKRCCTKCKGVFCCCFENRTLCFIISMVMANIHLFVYIVEVVFIFCFSC